VMVAVQPDQPRTRPNNKAHVYVGSTNHLQIRACCFSAAESRAFHNLRGTLSAREMPSAFPLCPSVRAARP